METKPTEELNLTEKFNILKVSHAKKFPIYSKTRPNTGDHLIAGDQYNNNYALVTVTKIDSRGVLYTDIEGLRFSSKSQWWTSTRKQPKDSWWKLFDIDACFERHLRHVAQVERHRLTIVFENLRREVSILNPVEDSEIIQVLLDRITTHKQPKP